MELHNQSEVVKFIYAQLLRVTENRYSGIPTIFKSFADARLPVPEFAVEHGLFKVIFRNGTHMADEAEIDKTDVMQAVLKFCQTPRSRSEITAFTGMSRYYTMSFVVQPLIAQGKLRMTMPEKPRSSNQRFVSKDESGE